MVYKIPRKASETMYFWITYPGTSRNENSIALIRIHGRNPLERGNMVDS
jgi:hypothetical protein